MATSAAPHDISGSSPIVPALSLLSFSSDHLAVLVVPPISTTLVVFNANCILCCPSGSNPYNQGVYTGTPIATSIAFQLLSPAVQFNLSSTLIQELYIMIFIAFQFPSTALHNILPSTSACDHPIVTTRVSGLLYWLQGMDTIVENHVGSSLLSSNSDLDVNFDLDNRSIPRCLTFFILSSKSVVHQLSTHSPTNNQITIVSVAL